MNQLPLTWYMESPIDFEHKQYVLLAYLQKVDTSFLLKNLSPHLLHMEKMINELKNYEVSYEKMRDGFDKNRYIYFNDNSKLIGENNELIIEIEEIVKFSIPQVKTRIEFGYKVFEKNRQILY
jgi:aminopeptidase-like protein